jgi:aminoglycoside 6'-N-acetyltransferase I
MWQIEDFRNSSAAQRVEAARILIEALAHVPSAWSDLPSALEEVQTFIENPERIGLMGLDDNQLRGWIGGIRHTPQGWELHPLVVDPKHQGRQYGRRLVGALEEIAREEGAITLWLGTDDDFGGTNIFGKNLYPDVLGQLQDLEATNGHPFTFYQRLGYCVTGVFPDVDGMGKHDILMAKRIGGARTGYQHAEPDLR